MLQLTDNQVLGAEPVDGSDADAPMEGELDAEIFDDLPDDVDAEGDVEP